MKAPIKKIKNNTVLFLPAYDEFLISYKSRHISLDPQFTSITFTNNGIFNPIIVHNAKVIGIWKPEYKKEISFKENFFIQPTEKQKQLCVKATKEFATFMQIKMGSKK